MKFKSKFKQIIKMILVGLQYVGYSGMFLLIPYSEYTVLKREGWSHILSPFFHFEMILNIITLKLFWMFLALTVGSYFILYLISDEQINL